MQTIRVSLCHTVKLISCLEMKDIPLYLDTILYSSVHHGRHLLLAVVNNDVVNTDSQTPAFCCLGYILKTGIAGSCSSIILILVNCL